MWFRVEDQNIFQFRFLSIRFRSEHLAVE